jgi:hypothetical protein
LRNALESPGQLIDFMIYYQLFGKNMALVPGNSRVHVPWNPEEGAEGRLATESQKS